jgi:hypothetical protein
MTAAHTPSGPVPLSEAERSNLLDALVDALVASAVPRGWRVESRSPTQAVLVRGRESSGGVHAFHCLMTLITMGLWVFVWILYAMSRHQERFTFTVDPYGEITES